MSLTSCIKKAGSALHPDDKQAILAAARTHRAAGLSPKDAAIKAVTEQRAAVLEMMPAATQAQAEEEAKAAAAPPPPPKADGRSRAAKARMAFNVETDSVLQAVAKMGGIKRESAAKEFGMRTEELQHKVSIGGLIGYPFRKTGGLDVDRAIGNLTEAGFFAGVPADGVWRAFEEAAYAEMGGAKTLTTEGQMRAAQDDHDAARLDAEERAEREAIMADAEMSEQETSAGKDDDLDFFGSSNVSTERAMRDMGFSEQEIQDELAREKTLGAAKAVPAQDAAAAAGEAPAAGRAGGEEAGALLPDAFALEGQTAEGLKARAARQAAIDEAGRARRKQDDARAAADAERDGFQLTGSDRPADVAAAQGQKDLLDPKTAFSRRNDAPVGLPPVVIGHPLATLNGMAGYAAAKAGDRVAALQIAKSMVTDNFAASIRTLIGDAKPLVVPVSAIESTGRNKIPAVAAEFIAQKLGLATDDGIVQSSSPQRTGMDGLDRLLSAPEFDGPVQAGQKYLLVDDTLTQGGTFAALESHIRQNGGEVIGAVALTGKQYSATMRSSPELLSQVNERFADVEPAFRAATGYGFDALTESEARYLAKHSATARIRDRITAAGNEARHGVGESRAEPGDVAGKAKGGPDIAFARNPLKAGSVREVADFTNDGKLNLNLGDAIDRGDWAQAYTQAKDPAQRKTLLSQLGDRLIDTFADSRIKVVRWIQTLPLAPSLLQRLEGDMNRSDSLRAEHERHVKDEFTEPMMKAITAAAKAAKLSTDQAKKFAGYWMAARYAPEASAQLILKDRTALLEAQAAGDPTAIALAQQNLNDRILDVNGALWQAKKRGVAGGMNNAEAALIVRNVEAKIDPALLQAIADPVYKMLDWKKAQDLATGKVTQTAVNSWLNSPRYVPLTGDPRADRETNDVFSTGGQLNQAADHAMNGRKDSVADDGIDAAFEATLKSINFSAMQDFKRSLNKAYEAAQAAGQDIGLTREPVTGIVRTGDDVVIYRDAVTAANGQQASVAHAFRFKDTQIMEALRKGNQEQVNKVLKWVSAPTRWYARAVTQFMPLFAPINLVRDIWERSEVLRTRKLYDQSGNLVDVGKAARAAIADAINRDVWRAAVGKAFRTGGRTLVRDELEEFMRLGGSSSRTAYLARTSGDLEAEIRGHGSKVGHVAEKLMRPVEAYNEAFEFVPQLAIYRALKAQNMAPKDAAAATLGLMNFHKKGTAMPAVRALYIFAQPAATGGYNLAQYLSTRTGQVRFATQMLIGTALYAMLKAVWGDDDDKELGNNLDNLSNFTTERSLPVKLGSYVLKLPVGFGPPQLAWAAAVTLNRAASGRYSPGDAALELAKGWVKNFAPVSPSDMEIGRRPVDFLVQTFVPTVLKPIANIYADQNNFGSPLTPAFKNKNLLKSDQANRTTAPIYKAVAQSLHDQLGIDVYPDHVKALTDGYLVGPVNEIVKLLVDNPAKVARGEPGRLPLVASLIDTINDRAVLNSIYGRVYGDMDRAHREFGSAMADPEKRADITAEQRQAEAAYQRFAGNEKVLGLQRAQLRKQQNLDDDTRSEKLQAIEERADASHRKLLVKYFQSLEK